MQPTVEDAAGLVLQQVMWGAQDYVGAGLCNGGQAHSQAALQHAEQPIA